MLLLNFLSYLSPLQSHKCNTKVLGLPVHGVIQIYFTPDLDIWTNLNPLQVSQEFPRDILPPYSSHCHKPFEGDLARTPSPIGNKSKVDQKAPQPPWEKDFWLWWVSDHERSKHHFTDNLLFLKAFYLISKYSWLKCGSFRWTAKGLSHIHPFVHSPPNSCPIQAATSSRVLCAICSRLLLVIHFKYSS